MDPAANLAPDDSSLAFLPAGGALGALIRRFDWSQTALGPLAEWPSSLKTVTAMLLLSPTPIALLWGERGVMIYNDAYSELAGSRHPQLLGSEVREGWPEVAEFNDNVMKVVLAGGALSYKDQELLLYRSGRPERAWMNLDYSPVFDDQARPAGVIALVVETTERVMAERELQRQQARLQQMFEQAPGLMAMLRGPEHVFEMTNPAYLRVVGERDVIGRPVREALPEVERQGFIDILDQVYRSGTAFVGSGIRVGLQRIQGEAEEERLLDFVFQPVTDANGDVCGIFVEGHDVTERAEAEQALRENEQRLRFLDALAKETARSVDADAILNITTRMLGEHLGLSSCAYADMEPDQDSFTIRGDWSAPGCMSIVGHYRLAAFGSLAVQQLRAGEAFIVDDHLARLPAADAATFQQLDIAATICLPLVKEGRLTALMAIHDRVPRVWSACELALLREVTDRSWAHIERVRSAAAVRQREQCFLEQLEAKVAERTAALARSEANIRAVLETSHLYMAMLAPDGAILYVNATALAGIGARFNELAYLPFWESPWFAATPGMPERVREMTRRVAAGATERVTMTLNMPQGVRVFDFSVRPVTGEDGSIFALVPEALDISERVNAEQALQQLHKMEALGNLTGGIAHDFNNLLMAVLGSLDLLRRRMPADPALLRLVDNARAGAERGASLTARMLTFARKQELHKTPIDLAQLIAGMKELLLSSLGPTIQLQVELPTWLARVKTDPNQLETALLNLAANARDAMAGVGHIRIAAEELTLTEEQNGLPAARYVRLELSDSGTGMDEATLKRAVEPFFTTKGVGKGTGLGLSMVHGLAEQSGGRLVLRSSPGAGTTAEIWLPALQAEYGPPSAPATPAHEETPRCVPKPLTLLAVDDDELVLFSTAGILEAAGHRVLSARSAGEALDLLRVNQVDILITDHAMPLMSGAQLAAVVRETRPQLPVLLVSGYAELPSTTPALALHRLAKPFTPDQLLDAIEQLRGGS
ncbi:PAS domain-containing protein [Stutzerimonas frequens]|uniref:PAS domain-containing protein n=1 Tax=Stutzerimonas frequens TaxID=2968969 RepID=UPI0007B8C837|nr:PAS domain-containing protein [Stutzerimonas frequens]MBA4726795.1 PAS domain-containing protein [Pseudomonas sp.]KZX51874.1 hybrid sensor histidine kinase/response regulator [Stutzerimonas frequens]MBK3871830.1 PAS domain-containing protein [Stutzerimonas frequens]MBK3910165.1 PAS domain-containing protein [Stutzerimonas frequens]MBK3917260.1 PAS domain-containing protein [Stutzerimonas frequens]